MNALKNKIKSQRGASITFALLLFLVCAVISGVVIVAATTAAGRMSTMEEMDERYYAVTNACELLCKKLDGQTTTVTYTLKADGTVDSATADVTGNPILKDASEKLILGGEEGNILPESFTQPVEITAEDGTKYNCSIAESLQGGTLTFDVIAEGGKINQGTYKAYKLSAVFASNVKKSAVDPTAASQTAIVTWKFRSLRKNRPVVAPVSTLSTP